MRRFLLIAALGASASTTPVAVAQGNIPQEVVGASRTLISEERTQIDAYIKPRVGELGDGDPSAVTNARKDLGQWPKAPGASDIFRRAYADAVREELRPLLQSKDEYRASNALMVLPTLLTAESLDELAENASPARQKAESVRIMAARLLSHASTKLAEPNPDFRLNSAQAEGYARRIREAALEETSWAALGELGTAVAEVGNCKYLPDDSRDKVRDELRRILEREVDLARRPEHADVIRAVQKTLGDLQKQLVEMRAASKAAYGQELQPILKSIRELAAKPPTGASEWSRRAYEKAVKAVDLIETILKTGRPQ
ncbi:MAG: hypothetical protein FJ253_11695 [Phycisphaerae bacterium]|nr:hypothetical protein [Phycisphaerae bacterium]